MVSLTVSVPSHTRELMKKFPEMNWSGFVRKSIERKAQDLSRMDRLIRKVEAERPVTDWSVRLQKASRCGRLEALKRKGLI